MSEHDRASISCRTDPPTAVIVRRMADSIVAIVAIMMVFGIPMSAIIGSFYLKAKRLQLASGDTVGAANRLARLEAENADLKQRVEVLETIVTSDAAPVRAKVRVEASPARESREQPIEVNQAAAKARQA